MDLQTMGDNALTSENASPTTTYVRIPHKQPVIVGHNRTPRWDLRSLGGTQIAVPAVDPLAAPSRMRILLRRRAHRPGAAESAAERVRGRFLDWARTVLEGAVLGGDRTRLSAPSTSTE